MWKYRSVHAFLALSILNICLAASLTYVGLKLLTSDISTIARYYAAAGMGFVALIDSVARGIGVFRRARMLHTIEQAHDLSGEFSLFDIQIIPSRGAQFDERYLETAWMNGRRGQVSDPLIGL